jgi:hypothetical protein
LERKEPSTSPRSFSESERTKIGVFMGLTVTRQPQPILKMH